MLLSHSSNPTRGQPHHHLGYRLLGPSFIHLPSLSAFSPGRCTCAPGSQGGGLPSPTPSVKEDPGLSPLAALGPQTTNQLWCIVFEEALDDHFGLIPQQSSRRRARTALGVGLGGGFLRKSVLRLWGSTDQLLHHET